MIEDLNSGLPRNKSCLWQGAGLEPGTSGLPSVKSNICPQELDKAFWSQHCCKFFPAPLVASVLFSLYLYLFCFPIFIDIIPWCGTVPRMFNLRLSLSCLLSYYIPALPAGILCASLALGEAGIEMYDLVSSCSLVRNFDWLESWQVFIINAGKREWNLLPYKCINWCY